MNIITLTGIAASILTAISLLPQLIKMIKEKKADDVSLGMLLVLLGGLILWVVYGFLKDDIIIIMANIFSIIVNVAVVTLTLIHKRNFKVGNQ